MTLLDFDMHLMACPIIAIHLFAITSVGLHSKVFQWEGEYNTSEDYNYDIVVATTE